MADFFIHPFELPARPFGAVEAVALGALSGQSYKVTGLPVERLRLKAAIRDVFKPPHERMIKLSTNSASGEPYFVRMKACIDPARVEAICDLAPYVLGYVDDKNKNSIRWARAVDFGVHVLGRLGVCHLLQAVGVDGLLDGSATYLTNPDIIASIEAPHFDSGASIDKETAACVTPVSMPTSWAEIERDYVISDKNLAGQTDNIDQQGSLFVYRATGPSGSIYIKRNRTLSATVEDYLALRIADGFGLNTPSFALIWRDDGPVIVTAEITAVSTRYLYHDMPAEQNLRLKREGERHEIFDILTDFRDMNPANKIVAEVGLYKFDFGGCLRRKPNGRRKENFGKTLDGTAITRASSFGDLSIPEKLAYVRELGPRMPAILAATKRVAAEVLAAGRHYRSFQASVLQKDIYEVLDARRRFLEERLQERQEHIIETRERLLHRSIRGQSLAACANV